MLLTPIINLVFKNVNRGQIEIFLIVVFVFQAICPTVLTSSYQLSNLGWFIYMYVVAAYLKYYGKFDNGNWKRRLFISLALYVVLFFGYIYSGKYYNLNSFLVVIIAVELFTAHLEMKPFYNKWVNVIASTTFGVYLIHDNPLIRAILWSDIFHNQEMYGKDGFLFFSVLTVVLVFAICALIDLARQKTVEKLWIKVVDKKILPSLPDQNEISIAFTRLLENSCRWGQRSAVKEFVYRYRKGCLAALILTLTVSIYGSIPLYRQAILETPGKTELLYTCTRYLINLIYLSIPLFFVLLHICKYEMKSFKENSRRIFAANTIIRALLAFLISAVALEISGMASWSLFIQSYMQSNFTLYMVWCIMLSCVYFVFRKY